MINKITPTRHFNDLKNCDSYFIKSSVDINKIAAEIKYYENIPKSLQCFYPKYMGRTGEGKWPTGYKINKILESDLSLYFTQLIANDGHIFKDLFKYLNSYFKAIPKKRVTNQEFIYALQTQIFDRDFRRVNSLLSTSSFNEINELFKKEGFSNIESFVNRLHSEIVKLANTTLHLETWFSHGDLCFSNILINKNQLILIDPRGIFQNRDDSYLIPYYDLAKLSQCIYGGYDFINHELDVEFHFNLKSEFETLINQLGLNFRLCRLIESSHFLAMLPLHINNLKKVKRFAQNSIAIFKGIK